MELILKRIAKKKSYTIGKLYIKEEDPDSPPALPVREGAVTCQEEEGPTKSPRKGRLAGAIDENTISQEHFTPLPNREGQGGESYFCDTLEPTWRDYAHGGYKMKGHSAIPEGRYPVVVTWSPKFQQWLPLLLHVPKFEGIRIHEGNTCCDTAGCILLGENREVGKVLDSRRYVNLLKRRLAARPEGEPVYITIE